MSEARSSRWNRLADGAWQRWEMVPFDTPDAVEIDPHEKAETPCRPDDEAILAEARDKAVEEGRRTGLENGHTEGYAAGHVEGLKQGTASGHAAGWTSGLLAAREQGADEARDIRVLAQTFADALSGIEEEMGQHLVTAALDIARQVVGSELSLHPECLVPAVRDVLHRHAGSGGPNRLWLHPADLELVRLHLADELKEAHWKLLADDAIARGGCRVETQAGAIDSTLQTRWRRVCAELGRESAWETLADDLPGEPHHD
jgi:flagellar assembly protein FliH